MCIRAFAAWVIIGSGLAGSPAIADGGGDAAPRYLLKPGRELSYHNEARAEGKGDGRVYIVDWKVWAIGRDADGAWRLVIRCDLKTREKSTGNPADQDAVDTLVWRCRLFEDGRLDGATTRGTVRDPFRLFPRLPASPGERAKGWTSSGPEGQGVTLRHSLAPGTKAGDGLLSFTTRAEGAEDKVYVLTHDYRATFDPRRGVVTRVDTEDVSGYPISAVTKGTIELVGVEDRGDGWAATFGREADRYFDAADAYDAAAKRAARDAARYKEILAEAKARLAEAGTGLAAPVFKDAIKKSLDGHDRMVGYTARQATDHAARLGKAAAEWEAKGIDGKTYRLADFRGKVVVMDFWYRGCGWCMHAMPQVMQVSEAFRDQPVAVLGMSIDENDSDARIVIDAMGIKYPTIKAAGIPEKYGVQGYPTLIVVDKVGKVREIHVGYSPHLFDELSGVIRNLLSETPVK